jgi:hypothetical protein
VATVTVTNVEQRDGGALLMAPISASAAEPPIRWIIVILSLTAVAAATIIMWFAYANWIKPTAIQIKTGYVPFAGLIVVTTALERLLQPLSQKLLPNDASAGSPAKQAADSTSAAHKAAADPGIAVADVQQKVKDAAADQAATDAQRTKRAIIFWAIASVCGLVISGGFGFFLLQSVASNHVNSLLDLAVTGLAIGAGTKPVHDLITSIQNTAASGKSTA